MAAVCVYCASSTRVPESYVELAAEVGTALAARGHSLVSGGGRLSMMGAIARAARAGGAHTVGVIPQALVDVEVGDTDGELVVVGGMRERKGVMDARADAFLALPGGLGTFEELFEVLTWAQLGLHGKPIGVLNSAGFFDPLVAMIDRAITDGFCREEHWRLFVVDDQPARLMQRLREHQPPAVKKWIRSSDET